MDVAGQVTNGAVERPLRMAGEPTDRALPHVRQRGTHMASTAPSAASQLNTEQNYLRRIDMRIQLLTVQAPGSSELARMRAAREDVLTRISPKALAAYEKAVNPPKNREQIAAEAEAERVAMEANRDRPAI